MISVIIPAHNAEETIGRALDSVLAQSSPDLEAIVVDDGSTDATAEVVEFHIRRDPRVRLLRSAHAGPSAARNAGIDVAGGEWLAFLDADDEYAPDAFETILERVGARDVGLVVFSIKSVRAYIYVWAPRLATLEDRYFPGEGERADAFIREYLDQKQMLVCSQSNKLYRHSVIEAHQLRFPEHLRFGEGRLFNYAYLRHAGSVLTMKERLLVYHCGHPGTLSAAPELNRIRALLALSEAKLDLFRSYGYAESDLADFRRSETSRLLDDAARELIRRDRSGDGASVREGLRELRAAGAGARLVSRDDAGSRRARLVQFAVRARPSGVATALVRMLRQLEDRRVLQRRRREIDRTRELERLGLTTASRRERARYYYLADYEHFLDRINDERFRNLLRDKAILLRRLAEAPAQDFLRRDWLDLRRASFSEFAAFLDRSDRIVAKEFNGMGSKGLDIVDVAAEGADATDLYERFLARKQYVLEAYLAQHPDLARFYGSALATLRIHTLNLGGEVQIVLPTAVGFGSKGGTTNNAGAIRAYFDLASGVITTDGMTEDEVLERHPDSGVLFRGATVPFAAEAGRLASAAALLVPELPFIGWDVACAPTGPAIVEGNAASLIVYSWQVKTRQLLGWRGMRAEFESILDRFTRFEGQHRPRTLHSERAGALVE